MTIPATQRMVPVDGFNHKYLVPASIADPNIPLHLQSGHVQAYESIYNPSAVSGPESYRILTNYGEESSRITDIQMRLLLRNVYPPTFQDNYPKIYWVGINIKEIAKSNLTVKKALVIAGVISATVFFFSASALVLLAVTILVCKYNEILNRSKEDYVRPYTRPQRAVGFVADADDERIRTARFRETLSRT